MVDSGAVVEEAEVEVEGEEMVVAEAGAEDVEGEEGAGDPDTRSEHLDEDRSRERDGIRTPKINTPQRGENMHCCSSVLEEEKVITKAWLFRDIHMESWSRVSCRSYQERNLVARFLCHASSALSPTSKTITSH